MRKYFFYMIIMAFLWPAGCATLHEASSTGDADRVQHLIKGGADINIPDKNGMTPLMLAAKADNAGVAAELLKNGADMALKDHSGKSAVRHAYDAGSFQTFKLLLENGAKVHTELPDSPQDQDAAPGKRFFALIQEYPSYQKIASAQPEVPVVYFDYYFSVFPDGVYRPEVEIILHQVLEKEFAAAAGPPVSIKKLDEFIDKYSVMGKGYYKVTANSLHIRNAPSLSAKTRGEYKQEDMIYAFAEKKGWIKTDRGWVSSAYTRQVPKIFSSVEMYLDKAREMKKNPPALPEKTPAPMPKSANRSLKKQNEIPPESDPKDPPITASMPAQAPVAEAIEKAPLPMEPEPDDRSAPQSAPESSPKMTEAETQPPPLIRPAPSAKGVRDELSLLLENPDLKGLEAFILKYKDQKSHAAQVERARAAYKKLLLNP